jgi:hypothetical protein
MDWQQFVSSIPDDWRIRAVLCVIALVCYGALVMGIGSFTAFGSHHDE